MSVCYGTSPAELAEIFSYSSPKRVYTCIVNWNCEKCSLLWERYYRASADEFLVQERLEAARRKQDRVSFAELALQTERASERTFVARLDITNHRLVH
jgi:hypothetical protein